MKSLTNAVKKYSVQNTLNNSRYKSHNQEFFTAGDEQQFTEHKTFQSDTQKTCEPSNNENIYKNTLIKGWNKYNEIDDSCSTNTFRYMFNKFKKGIYVKITNNNVSVFLPFSKHKFTNEWCSNIDSSNIDTIVEYICKQTGYKFNKKKINRNVHDWFANNHLVRYEYPVSETETNIANIKHMLDTLCLKRKLPDVEFFINKRDFPILKRDETEAYESLWNSNIKKLVSHNYDCYTPILSMCNTDDFADVLIPNHNDWSRIQACNQKTFNDQQCTFNSENETDWNKKYNIAIFRGSSTGEGVTVDTNIRLKACKLSDECNDGYLDAGITKWNLRPRKIKGVSQLQTINVESVNIKLKDFKTPFEQSKYKYILNLDGHVASFRLSNEMSYKSVILKVESKWKLWFSHLLKPWVHYVPVKEDLSDLLDIIKWCLANDTECAEIASNSYNFYNTYLNENSTLDYLQKICNEVSSMQSGNKLDLNKYRNDLNLMMNDELSLLQSITREQNFIKTVDYMDKKIYNYKTVDDSSIFPNMELLNEFFVSNVKINKLSNQIPNFITNLSYENCDNHYYIKQQLVEGDNLYNFIRNNDLKLTELSSIVIQICLAIDMAKHNCNFIHNDLTPWNIIIKKTKEPVEINYKLSNGKTFEYHTNLLAVIVDYGKSKIIHKGKHYGLYNRYVINNFQDIIVFVITTIKCLLLKRQDKSIFSFMMHMVSFFENSSLTQSRISSCKELHTLIDKKSKFSDLLLQNDKGDFHNTTPLAFLRHLNSRYNTIPYIESLNIFDKIHREHHTILMTFVKRYENIVYNDKMTNIRKYKLLQILLKK